jgi:LysM repeat protein
MNYTAMFSNVSSWLTSSAGKGVCLLGLTFTLSVPVSAAIAPMDSIGVEVSNGNLVIIHKVEPKETLFSISRRYGAAVADIKSVNPGIENGLMIGQVIKVPTQRRATAQAASTSAAQGPATNGAKTHTVAPQQTLYAIATMHKVTVEELRTWNKLSGNEISIGQQLIVSAPGGQRVETAPVTHRAITTIAEEPAKVVYPPNGIHKVGPSQTLYSIATMYNLSVDELKKMNNIQVDDLSVGQELAVTPAAARTLQAQAPQEAVPVNAAPVNHYPAPAQTASTGGMQPENTSSTVNITGYDKVVETGLAEVIDSPVETSKYMALHKTAPVGTILTIKNDMNGTSVFVRVIGRLPETGINDKVVVRISKKAFERLNPVDKRFPVEVSYIP